MCNTLKQNRIGFLPLLFAALSLVAAAQHLKVDLDVRSDSTAAGFLPWYASDGPAKTFGDLAITLDLVSPPANTAWKINWFNKDGLNKYELAMDCLYANFDDGTESRPSYTGGTLRMTIAGLAEGPHTLITYHNAPWPLAKYNRAICPCRLSIDGVEQLTVQPSQYALDNNAVESTFLTFHAQAGVPVQITFEPLGDPAAQLCTAVLSGFEIDNLASVDSYATNPSPADGDRHVFAHNDDALPNSEGSGYAELSWTPSAFAAHHDVYFGSDEVSVTNATTETPNIYRGRQPGSAAAWTASGLNTKDTYYWRIDTVKPDGTITKGYVWRFQTRHLAFPTAEGYGRFARGGRYGRVLEVTTLDDYDPDTEPTIPGSLRAALEVEKGPRIVVFRVGGSINLKKRITIPGDGGDVYVAGQTAPGEGICLTRGAFGALGASDVVIRHIRCRVGDYHQTAMDGIGLSSCDHGIVDHCSISWTLDEGHSSRGARNITFQRNIISEALHDSYHYGTHAFAASISGSIGSYHHNLLAHCTGRNWSLAGGVEQDGRHYAGHVDIRNNVVYNWRDRTTDGGCRRVNFVNNYYKPGPALQTTSLMRPDGNQMGFDDMQQFYIVGNRMVGYIDPAADNWDHVFPNYAAEAQVRVDAPFFPSHVTTQTADAAYADVLADVGATRPRRDPIDTRVIREVQTGTFTYRGSKQNLPGIIDSQEDVGGYPAYAGGPVPADSDHDGLPNWWELRDGLNPNSPPGDWSDTHADPDSDGYTRMDDYLEYLAQDGYQFETWNCPAGIPADLNNDCRVSLLDLVAFADALATQSPQADWNNDNIVDLADLARLAADWLTCHRTPAAECP